MGKDDGDRTFIEEWAMKGQGHAHVQYLSPIRQADSICGTTDPLWNWTVGDSNFLPAHPLFLPQTCIASKSRESTLGLICFLYLFKRTDRELFRGAGGGSACPLLGSKPPPPLLSARFPPLNPSLEPISHRFEMLGWVGEEVTGVGWEFGESFIPCISKAVRLLRGGNDW